MKTRWLIQVVVGILAFLGPGFLFAQVSDPFAEHAVASPEVLNPHEPDHLIPVDPYPDDWSVRYANQLRERFGLDSTFYFRMLVRPSFDAEYSVSLIGDERHYPWKIDSDTKLTMKYVVADKSIWYAMPDNNDEKKQKDVNVTIQTTEIPMALALRLIELWDQMLLGTRYSSPDIGGLDGATYEFAMWQRYGETWSPHHQKSPLLFVELGESLVDLCKAPPANRDFAVKKVEEKAAKLETYLKQKTTSDTQQKAEPGATGQPATRSESK